MSVVADTMIALAGGVFSMGSNDHYPEERPLHKAKVAPFRIDRYPVTNREFARFVRDTGHVTAAERPADPRDYPGADPALLVPSSVVFVAPAYPVPLTDTHQWWHYVPSADWRHPRGPFSSLAGLEDHPVVHVTHADALAYARWLDKDLPTEAEWEFAAKGGNDATEFAWGDSLLCDGRHMANTWQGEFPWQNLETDGHRWTSPVGSYPPNGYGLYDMIGNVWEWTSDWYQQHDQLQSRPCCAIDNPRGGARETSHDPRDRAAVPRRVMKGGSHLCAPNYCRRYRPGARMAQPIDTSTCHLGFRCVERS
ncbi:formylglycine-generating enzyme family protein [Stenotrophomonas sp. GZD-301]|uniref:formylglycine-generating enzyme family protein n=1 Tax=Stenotrophomonas sp. GZD-301 TaxID=3404814 RepID=UPI003BB56505